MTERLLQYIWQFQYFNKYDLETTNGEKLIIFYPGMFNSNQGPDFLESRVKIESNTWIGNIELHINASDWHRHAHASDPNYANIILHVIWNDDDEHPCHDIPTLLLGDRVPKLLLQQYEHWMKSDSVLPCGFHLQYAEEITWMAWKERLLVERLQRKSETVLLMLKENNYHWEEACWWMLARNYGLPVNSEAFEEIARSIPYETLMRHRKDLRQLETLLFKQSECISQRLHLLRMRPAAFPAVRLRQLIELVYQHEDLLSIILNAESIKYLRTVFQDNVIINTVLPLLSAYGYHHSREEFIQKAIEFATLLPPEKNSITRSFQKLGIENKSAAGSQALIELKTQYCDKRRCLDCAIGNIILKRKN